ncbi:MAG: cytochrome C biogenesis protein, partial [Chloroflexi bacterium]|nr:cytochrome C biogenesis protein [Chloroflexota bacterium]
FPIIIPVLIAAVRGSNGFLQGLPLADIMPFINFLLVYDVIFIAVAFDE